MNTLENHGRIKRVYMKLSIAVICACLLATSALATGAVPPADDPLDAINNLSDFVFTAIRAIGVILLGWGIVQIGMSLQSHDPSQRTNGFLCFFGGLLIAMSKAVLDLILA